MSDSKSGSKTNLNESNMPLLDDVEKTGETPEKEQIELKEGEEKKDDSSEKKNKKKKEKKPKEKKEKGPNCIEIISKDLDMGNRDCNSINLEIDLDFDDVIAEPSAAQGFEWVWKLAFVVFSQTKTWLYKIFSAILAVPAALMWALVFALLTVVYIWILSPALKLFDLTLAVVKRVVVGLMKVTVEPVCSAFGHVFSRMSVEKRMAQEA